ncbi:hypothetical protein ACFOET_03935 [Parapedobacter deserti]|uniref:Uncharacterized protein n=1 Tax=Parapedobacter deserti TaxID=1912957 RepID=A0ABV7JFC2_9SPHI
MNRDLIGKVLITQGTRPFAQRVAKLMSPISGQVLFGSSDDVPNVLLRTGSYLKIPQVNAPAFIHEVLKVCLDRGINTLLPLGIHELYPMAEAQQLFSEYSVAVWVPEVTELDSIPVIKNPPVQLPLIVFKDGVPLGTTQSDDRYRRLSGVFSLSDSGDEAALCCIAD